MRWAIPKGLAVLLAFGLATAAPLAAEPLDQFGHAQPWQGRDDGYTVVDFAASWCAPCWKTLPKLVKFAEAHPEITVLVVSVDDNEAGRRELIEGLDLELPVLWDGDYQIAQTYTPEALPATFVLAPGGEVAYRHIGSDKEEWEKLIRFLEGLKAP